MLYCIIKAFSGLGNNQPLESTVKAEWGEAKGFYWNDFLKEVGTYLRDDEERDEEDIGAALCELIKYKLKKLKDLNISDNKKEFAERLSAKGVPDAICDLLLEKYVARKGMDRSNIDSLALDFNDQALQTLGNDGISFEGHHLNREVMVQSVIDAAATNRFVESPPATGKTSLVQLVAMAKKGEKVCYFAVRPGEDGVEWLFNKFMVSTGIDLNDTTVEKLGQFQRIWVLMDDAQEAYDTVYYKFWQALVKDSNLTLGSDANKIQCVIAATYDLNTPKPPVAFPSMPHVPRRGTRVGMSYDEAEELFEARARNRHWGTWKNFKATLMEISNGHIGVSLIQGIRLLEGMRLEAPRDGFSEEDALNRLRGRQFFDLLSRCFPSPGSIPKEQLDCILDAMVHGTKTSTSSDPMEVEDSWEKAGKLTLLKRGGILTTDSKFTSLAAEWYYNNKIFPDRPLDAPPNIETLITNSVSSMSATRLRGQCDGGFPKEAAFQQLFNEAICLASCRVATSSSQSSTENQS